MLSASSGRSWPDYLRQIQGAQALISKKTGSSICRSEMKSLVAIFVGPIQYIEIPLVLASLFDECQNVMNNQQESE